MHIGHQYDTKYKYYMSNGTERVELQPVKAEKDVGVTITDDLRPRTQCLYLSTAKARKITGMVRRNFRRLDCQYLLLINNTYIRPHLEYCIQSWSPYLRKDIQCLEGIQRAITKLVPALRKLDYGQRLQKLGLTTLETRRRRGDLIETFKIMTGKEKLSSEQLFHLLQLLHWIPDQRPQLEGCETTHQTRPQEAILQPTSGQRMEQSTSACDRVFDSEHVQGQTGQVLARHEQ